MADVTLKIDADTARYIAKLSQAAAETKKLGKTTGDGLSGALDGVFTRSLLKVELLKKALQTVAQVADEINNKQTEASRRSGDRAVSMAESLASLGVKDIRSASNAIQSQTGAASTDQRVSFLEALSNANDGARVPIDSDTALAAADLYARGGDISFGRGGKEILEGLKRGDSLKNISRDSSAKRPGLSDPYLFDSTLGQELGVRDTERRAELEADRSRSEEGLRLRAGRTITEPNAAGSAAGEVFGSILNKVGVRGFSDRYAGSENGLGYKDLISAIALQTDDLRQLNLSGQGEGGR